MNKTQTDIFHLDNFEGPLEFLLHLIQKAELDIHEIPVSRLTRQFLERPDDLEIDAGAEFVGNASLLLWLKSKMLLPKHEQEVSVDELQVDPRFEIIHQLMDYCRFKEAAKELSQIELRQNAYYLRGAEAGDPQKNMGIEHVSLEELSLMFKQVLSKSVTHVGQIQEEEWKVSDKIRTVRFMIKEQNRIEFDQLFIEGRSRIEWIVTFLAVLELMKIGDIKAQYDRMQQKIIFTL